jgi:hypothetical protein
MSAGVKPDRAQTGSGLTGGCPAHPFEVPAPAGAVLPWAGLAWTAPAGVMLACGAFAPRVAGC